MVSKKALCYMDQSSFTLLELVIVIGILAILAVVVILVINPVEFLKQARDSNRLSDIQTIDKALGLYESDGGSSFGSSNTVYVSIPDSSATCNNLGLPDLPDGYSYACSDEDNYRKIDGNGWIPVNLTTISFGGSPLNVLPIDPTNSTSTGNYYTYTTGGSWELNAFLESKKYRNSNACSQYLPGIVKTGTNLSLSPIADTEGLVGYWKFDEGEGITATDSSGNSNTGTLTNGPDWTTGKVGNAVSFDGVDDYVDCGSGDNVPLKHDSPWTLMAWFNVNQSGSWKTIIGRCNTSASGSGACLTINSGGVPYLWVYNDSGTQQSTHWLSSVNYSRWTYIAVVHTNSSVLKYLDGEYEDSFTVNGYLPRTDSYVLAIGKTPHYYSFSGLIDEVRIYNRALSAAEIAAIYNGTK